MCCTNNLTPTTTPSEDDEEDLLVYITRQSSKGVTSVASTKSVKTTTSKTVLKISTASRKPSTFQATTKSEVTTQLTKPPLRVSGVAIGGTKSLPRGSTASTKSVIQSTTTETAMTTTTKTPLSLKPAETSSSATPPVTVPVITSTSNPFPTLSKRVPMFWKRRPQQGN